MVTGVHPFQEAKHLQDMGFLSPTSYISGKMIKSHTVQAAVGSNLVVLGTDELASGMYFLNISSGESQQAIQFVVK